MVRILAKGHLQPCQKLSLKDKSGQTALVQVLHGGESLNVDTDDNSLCLFPFKINLKQTRLFDILSSLYDLA